MRHHDRRSDARARRRKRKRLAMIAARRTDYSLTLRPLAPGMLDEYQPAAQFECADRRVIFVLDHDFHARARAQYWPGILRRRRHARADHRDCALELGTRE